VGLKRSFWLRAVTVNFRSEVEALGLLRSKHVGHKNTFDNKFSKHQLLARDELLHW
jgi:hypothetical protein